MIRHEQQKTLYALARQLGATFIARLKGEIIEGEAKPGIEEILGPHSSKEDKGREKSNVQVDWLSYRRRASVERVALRYDAHVPLWFPPSIALSYFGHGKAISGQRAFAIMALDPKPLPSTRTPAFCNTSTVLLMTAGSTPSVWSGNLTVLSHSLASSSE